ncbi:MAG: L-histidine N(alpha)-methyltransferase [Candidatus Thiodiazotropha sp. (ex. Lucinisca nassula)]|nr:L-histidine N(alpha)-methyltransferase [Candidatus Thiodiazotropha sp. (ex. Lucinisca nassula)]MBW9268745.1 L-histidine N(alpha)-methyltransferase [Candidatus Thiodiazotropha sp. (ex. Lucinisca nassula)]
MQVAVDKEIPAREELINRFLEVRAHTEALCRPMHTENSYKYEPEEFLNLASKAGMVTGCHRLAEEGLFGIYLLETAASG